MTCTVLFFTDSKVTAVVNWVMRLSCYAVKYTTVGDLLNTAHCTWFCLNETVVIIPYMKFFCHW